MLTISYLLRENTLIDSLHDNVCSGDATKKEEKKSNHDHISTVGDFWIHFKKNIHHLLNRFEDPLFGILLEALNEELLDGVVLANLNFFKYAADRGFVAVVL